MKVEGSNITITDSVYNKMSIIPKGACEQEGTPTPDYPQDIRVVTGDNSVVVQNKNIFDGIFESGSLNEGVPVTDAQCIRSKNYINVQPNTTYTLSADNNTSLFVAYYDVSKNWLSNDNIQNTPRTITTPNNCYYIKIRTIQSENITDLNTKAQIEVGSTATSYVPHQEQTYILHLGTNYLAGIGDYKDKIVGKTNEWKIVRNCNKVNVKDLEWSKTNSQPDNIDLIMFSSQSLSDRVRESSSTAKIYCNYLSFTGTANSASNGKNKGIGVWLYYNSGTEGKSVYIILTKSIASDTTELVNWANTNNVIFIYKLEESTETPITDTTLITDLNNMYQAMGYDGKTNITVTSEDTNAQMEVEVTYTSESDMCEKLLFIFNKMKDKLYHIIRSL